MAYFKLGLVLSVLFSVSLVNCGIPTSDLTNLKCTVSMKPGGCQGKDTISYKDIVCQCVEQGN